MVGPVLRAGAWPAVVGLSGVAVVVGGFGAAFPAAATMLFPICFALLAAAAAFTLDEPASLLVADGIRSAGAGCLYVELLQNLDRQCQVAVGQDVVGALGLILLCGVA